jgi:sulfatase modifying factor 1
VSAASPAVPAPLETLPEVFPEPWACDWGEDRQGLWMAFRVGPRVGGVRQALRWVPPGTFLMGSPDSERERLENERQHEVVLTQGLWLAETACTQALWRAVMRKNPSRFEGPERPVEQVSWEDVQRFLARLNELVPSLEARLPTEAEWEYACRASTDTPFWFGDQITTEQANYDGNYPYAGGAKGVYREQTVDVKDLPANGWGLYQMHGNVWEWCADWYGEYPQGPVTDPAGPDGGGDRVLRGGSWFNVAGNLRSAYRSHDHPGLRHAFFGFRLARGQSGRGAEPQARDAGSRAGQT